MISKAEELVRYKIRKGKENSYLSGKNQKGQTYSYLQVLSVLSLKLGCDCWSWLNKAQNPFYFTWISVPSLAHFCYGML